MSFNTMMIFIVLILFGVLTYIFIRKTSNVKIEENDEDPYTISALIQRVDDTFTTTLRRSLKDLNLSRQELERSERIKRELREAIRQSSIGDTNAKKFVKSSIIGIICNVSSLNAVTESTVDRVIKFADPDSMDSRDQFETLLYIYQNLVRDNKTHTHTYGADGIKHLFKDFNWLDPVPGTNEYLVTKEMVRKAYDSVIARSEEDMTLSRRKELVTFDDGSKREVEYYTKFFLNFSDKREIIAQRIFEDLEGFGPVDMLLDTDIDEVQGGVSGIPRGSYEFKNRADSGNIQYSYESIWIVMSGLTIRLKFLSFGTQDELIRVCSNIYKYDAPNVMSRTMGKVVSTMKDGSRIVVVRPPFADSYAFFARKFDSTPSIAPEDLIRDKYNEIPIKMIKWLVKGSQNIAITGDQGCGKTTMLKSLIRFIREDYTLRIQELTPELNLRYAYPDRNVVSFRETDTISSQEGLDLQKKTSGSVNIVGEVATAEAASWIIQTAKVGSKMAMFTHHAKTTDDLVVSLRNNLMQVNNYTDNAAVDEMIAESLNIDIHLTRKKGKRFIERVTEIIPITDRSYPYDELSKKGGADAVEDADLKREDIINENEYRKRMTDRILFTSIDLVKFNEEKQRYELINLPTEHRMESIRENLNIEEEKEMEKEFSDIVLLDKKQKEEDGIKDGEFKEASVKED